MAASLKLGNKSHQFGEALDHKWVHFDGEWHRFTLKEVEDAKAMAEKNKEDLPPLPKLKSLFK